MRPFRIIGQSVPHGSPPEALRCATYLVRLAEDVEAGVGDFRLACLGGQPLHRGADGHLVPNRMAQVAGLSTPGWTVSLMAHAPQPWYEPDLLPPSVLRVLRRLVESSPSPAAHARAREWP